MGLILTLSPESLHTNDELVSDVYNELKRIVTVLTRFAKIMEEIIYENDMKTQKLVFRDFTRTSLYQIFGQSIKSLQEIYYNQNPFYNLLHLIGRIEKLVGQNENDFLKTLNYLLLEPIQLIRIIHSEKLTPSKIRWSQLLEIIAKLEQLYPNSRDNDKSMIYKRKTLTIKEQIIPAIIEIQELLIKLQNNIHYIIIAHLESLNKMSTNLTHLLKIIEKNKNYHFEKNYSIKLPNKIKDYRQLLYSSQNISDTKYIETSEKQDLSQLSKLSNEITFKLNNDESSLQAI